MKMSPIFCYCGLAVLIPTVALAEIELLATGTLPGTDRDRSDLRDELEPGLPHDLLGGFSAIDYSGHGDEYLALPDRGPGDGAFPYRCRIQRLRIVTPHDRTSQLVIELLSTKLLTDEAGEAITGSAAAIDIGPAGQPRRFDPEGFRLGRGDEIFISDEYGPALARFQKDGRRHSLLPLPAHLMIAHPSSDKQTEASTNSNGRQPNKGMEGLAITPDRRKLVGVMQGPLIQDSAPVGKGKYVGLNLRLLEIDLKSQAIREFVYHLDSPEIGISEILAINDHEFLVIERDGESGAKAACKNIVKIDLAAATDISKVNTLPSDELPEDIKPVKKTQFLNLLDPSFGLAGKAFPEKVEGITFGPTLSDGRRQLIVCVDNDFKSRVPSYIYSFAIDREDLPEFGWSY